MHFISSRRTGVPIVNFSIKGDQKIQWTAKLYGKIDIQINFIIQKSRTYEPKPKIFLECFNTKEKSNCINCWCWTLYCVCVLDIKFILFFYFLLPKMFIHFVNISSIHKTEAIIYHHTCQLSVCLSL